MSLSPTPSSPAISRKVRRRFVSRAARSLPAATISSATRPAMPTTRAIQSSINPRTFSTRRRSSIRSECTAARLRQGVCKRTVPRLTRARRRANPRISEACRAQLTTRPSPTLRAATAATSARRSYRLSSQHRHQRQLRHQHRRQLRRQLRRQYHPFMVSWICIHILRRNSDLASNSFLVTTTGILTSRLARVTAITIS